MLRVRLIKDPAAETVEISSNIIYIQTQIMLKERLTKDPAESIPGTIHIQTQIIIKNSLTRIFDQRKSLSEIPTKDILDKEF
jgi:hypothetical protein